LNSPALPTLLAVAIHEDAHKEAHEVRHHWPMGDDLADVSDRPQRAPPAHGLVTDCHAPGAVRTSDDDRWRPDFKGEDARRGVKIATQSWSR
jgi:hypothetical protein